MGFLLLVMPRREKKWLVLCHTTLRCYLWVMGILSNAGMSMVVSLGLSDRVPARSLIRRRNGEWGYTVFLF